MHLSALCGASSAYLFIPRALDARRRGARTRSARTRRARSEIASREWRRRAAQLDAASASRRARARVATRTARAMALTTSVARARDARASADRVVGLVGGLRVVVDALREHAADGLATNVAHVREDAMYVVFLAASVIGFGTVASGEMMSLRRRRDRARAALKECATMLDLKSKETSGAAATAAVGRKTRDAGRGEADARDRGRERLLERVGISVKGGVSHGGEPRRAVVGRAVHAARHAHAVDGQGE